jgi:heat shock protein HtpX
MINFYEAEASNKRRSGFILVLFFLFVGLAAYFMARAIDLYYGYQFGSLGFVGLALIISGITSFLSYYFSDRIVLGISRARKADRQRDFNFYTVAENLAIGAGLPKPDLYVIDDSAPNAFATGRDPKHAVICATTGLLDKLKRSELEGVIAHELGHIKNYDTRLQTVVAVMVGLIALLGDWFLRIGFRGNRKSDSENSNLGVIFLVLGLVFALVSPIIAKLIQLAISRKREFGADASSVALTRNPQELISALTIISQDTEPLEAANKATAHLYIINPFKSKNMGGVGKLASLFNTHPPVYDRIKALKEMM